MRLTVEHRIRLSYDDPADFGIQYLRLSPRNDPCQTVREWTVYGPGSLIGWRDHLANQVTTHTADTAHETLAVGARGVVDTADTVGVIPSYYPPHRLMAYLRRTALTAPGDGLTAFAESHRAAFKDGTLAGLHAMMADLHRRMAVTVDRAYRRGAAEAALDAGTGCPADLAHIFIAGARHLGIPARLVTGYCFVALEEEGPKTLAHAWAEALIDNLGWVSFDPVHDRSATDAYVRCAVGFDHDGAAPWRGVQRGGTGETLNIDVRVSAEVAVEAEDND